jgi:hypothetical protein
MLYQGSRNGFKSSEFHRRCDGRRHIITIIKSTDGDIFGGYTPLAFSSNDGWQTDTSLQTFLFTVKNPHKISLRKFMIQKSGVKAIYCSPDRFAFGAEHSLRVWDNNNGRSDNHVHFGSSFENGTGINPQNLLNGSEKFTVQEIAVFAVVE